MGGNKTAQYLDGLPPAQAAGLARVNKPGLTALRDHLATGQAVAFLGAGVSAPLYPLWTGLIGELVDAAAGRLGAGAYREALRQVLRVRPDPETGRSWTPVQELVCRCAFTAVAAKADALNARLVPPGLDPDPLGTVERIVAEQKAAEAAEESED